MRRVISPEEFLYDELKKGEILSNPIVRNFCRGKIPFCPRDVRASLRALAPPARDRLSLTSIDGRISGFPEIRVVRQVNFLMGSPSKSRLPIYFLKCL